MFYQNMKLTILNPVGGQGCYFPQNEHESSHKMVEHEIYLNHLCLNRIVVIK